MKLLAYKLTSTFLRHPVHLIISIFLKHIVHLKNDINFSEIPCTLNPLRCNVCNIDYFIFFFNYGYSFFQYFIWRCLQIFIKFFNTFFVEQRKLYSIYVCTWQIS